MKPNPPHKNVLLSNQTSTFIYWDRIYTADLPMSGYILYVDDGLTGEFVMAYNGSLNPAQVSYRVNNLVPGRTYRFKVRAMDYNGQGYESEFASYLSCLAPIGVKQPKLDKVDKTTFTITWELPESDGGCPITSYAIYRDDGAGGFIVTPVDPVAVQGNPYLFRHTATLLPADTGKTFRVKVEAINLYGSLLSPSLQFVLADVPGNPYPAPSVDISNTTTS